MKCFLIERIDRVTYDEDYAMVIIAEDEIKAKTKARLSSRDFREAKLNISEINMNEDSCVLIANTGA